MLRVGLVGLGFMGAAHAKKYIQLEKDGVPVKLVAICDIDADKLSGSTSAKGNINVALEELDLSAYNLYYDMGKMIKAEELDYVDICLPTFLHGEKAIEAMKNGVHVFCEKPMALTSKICREMIDTAISEGKYLMIGQTLRYWNVYEYAKSCIDNNTYGKCSSAYFFRGGSSPKWSWDNWLLDKERSGGCLLDQHIHDVDAINWMFGMPTSVFTVGQNMFEGSGYDSVSTNYVYENKTVVNSQDDWTINGNGYGFSMLYRINFEKAALIYENWKLTVYPTEGESFTPEMSNEDAYYKELRIFYELLTGENEFDYISLLESHLNTIKIAEAEQLSAETGHVIKL